jgi:hypothetical protein
MHSIQGEDLLLVAVAERPERHLAPAIAPHLGYRGFRHDDALRFEEERASARIAPLERDEPASI